MHWVKGRGMVPTGGIFPWCWKCDLPWRGDAATGGCEARLLAREVVALRGRAGRQQARHIHELMVQKDTIIALQADCAEASARVALLEGLLRDLVTKGEAMKEALFTGNDTQEAIACMEWDDAVGAALADGG